MRLSHKHKFVFIAVPKTASLVIRSILDEYSCVKYEYGHNKKTNTLLHWK